MISFCGNLPYCYANAAAMLLNACIPSNPYGPFEEFSPHLIEVLTGVGFGAIGIPNGPTFFGVQAPDAGLSRAFDLLGCAITEECGPADADTALLVDILRRALDTGPVVIGPLDMGFLTYDPDHGYKAGSDHFVLAYALDDDAVFVHDPAGIPYARLPFLDLERAWRAESIGSPAGVMRPWYGREPFRRWYAPSRVTASAPTFDRLYASARAYLRELVTTPRTPPAWPTGPYAIHALARALRTSEAAPSDRDLLRGFSLPLGAGRALDYARFFERGGDPELAEAKRAQSEAFGAAARAARREAWPTVAARLDTIAELELTLTRLLEPTA